VRRLLSGSFCPNWAEMEGEKGWQPIGRPARGLRVQGLVVAIAEISRFRCLSHYQHFMTRSASASALFDSHLHQPFFLQLSRGKRAFLLLVPMGPAVMRRRCLELTDRARCRLDGAFAFARPSLGLLSAGAAAYRELTFASACALSATLLPWLCKFARDSRGVHLDVRHHGTSKWAFSVEKFQVTIFRYIQKT
jgi:hypothetical protein